MNGFLVIARGLIDDIPLGLFRTEDEARACALDTTDERVGRMAREVYDIEPPSEVVGISIVPIVDGRPQLVIWPIIPQEVA